MEEHFGHAGALLMSCCVALAFTYLPFLVLKLFMKDPRARKYLSREWIVIAFLSAVVTYVILRDGALMDKPIVSTIFWCFCINVGVFQAGRLLEKGLSVKYEKNGTKIEIEQEKAKLKHDGDTTKKVCKKGDVHDRASVRE
jgi:hypothetical protein